MQKFSMRFRVASDAQVFLDFVRVQPSPPAFIEQESLTDKNMIGNSETDLRSEISSAYEFVSSNRPCYRINEESPLNAHPTDYFMNPLETTRLLELPPVATDSAELSPAATYSPKMPQYAACIPKIQPVGVSPEIGLNTCSQLLSVDSGNFCGSLLSSFSALLTTCAAEAGKVQLSLAPEEIDIKSQSMQHMSGSSFHGV
ncbi:hypothetical protein C5167_035612 [Papaver somniferum]|uniref:Uncharacterized protein n=2 Tax=Papaver somniferum TaxID=3469 RepID=A0A4Y7KI86_PAPSO|nr:hypothetical protein C5167_035612 [Papaver somniferum]